MRISSIVYLALPLAFLTACEGTGVHRLGGRLKTLTVASESREILPRRSQQILKAERGRDCILHAGLTNQLPDASLEFVIGADRFGEPWIEEYSVIVQPGEEWTDISVPLRESRLLQRIKLTVKGDDPEKGIWSRPILVCAQATAIERSNVLLVSLDTLRADRLGVYGNEGGLTPNLDRIAQEGTVFVDAYAHYPNTLGSHATLFTGAYPSVHGLIGGTGVRLARDTPTLAKDLQRQGYITVAFTEDAYVGSGFGFDIGFDRYHDGWGTTEFAGEAEATFERALEWLEERPQAPFLMFLHTYEVHTPYTPSEERLQALREISTYDGQYESDFGSLQVLSYNFGDLDLSAADLAWIERLYNAETTELDERVGQLFESLAELGLEDSTLVVLFSDHGEEFNEHGHLGHGETLYEETLRVPLIWWAPTLVPAGRRVQGPIGLIDVAPTIGELIGEEAVLPQGSGTSRAAWILGERGALASPVFSELEENSISCKERGDSFQICPYGALSVRDAEYAYIHASVTGEEFLFDRTLDPDESSNIASERTQVIRRFRELADSHRRSVAAQEPKVEPFEVDPAVEEKLRALGYVE